jgi:hypothetical protein
LLDGGVMEAEASNADHAYADRFRGCIRL